MPARVFERGVLAKRESALEDQPMVNRRSFLLGACASGMPVAAIAGPADLLSSLTMTFRFTNAGIPIRSFSMSSRSEEPTLRAGDVVLADLRSAGQEPARGDLIVFRLRDGKTEWMKRVVGLPGERIAMIDGRSLSMAPSLLASPCQPMP